jgi:hypothetical protein
MLDLGGLDPYGDPMPTHIAVVRYDKRPWTLNAERSMHRMERAKLAREWRDAFHWLARMNHLPKVEQAIILVQPHLKGKRSQDCDACHPAAKAAIDGLVDAGVLKGDSPQYVTEIRYLAPLMDSTDGLTIIVAERKP